MFHVKHGGGRSGLSAANDCARWCRKSGDRLLRLCRKTGFSLLLIALCRYIARARNT